MTHRVQRVRELIRRELSMILEREFSFGGSLLTVHAVDVTPDLKQCFVYVGVLGPEQDQDDILAKLAAARGSIQKSLYKRVILKHSPQLLFRIDKSVERGVRVLSLIDSLPPPAPDAPDEASRGQEN